MNDYPYSPETVRAILNCLSNIEAAAERGTILVNPSSYRMTDLEDKLAASELQAMSPAPSGRRNAPYRIDSAGAIWLDIKNALKALPLHQRRRILLHYYYGYEHSEIAEMEGCSEGSIKVAVKRSIEKMAEWLESEKKPVDVNFPGPREGDTHTRKYTSVPPYSFA